MDMKRFFLYAIAIAALALAGCGGNGGMTQMPDDDDDDDDGATMMVTCSDGSTWQLIRLLVRRWVPQMKTIAAATESGRHEV